MSKLTSVEGEELDDLFFHDGLRVREMLSLNEDGTFSRLQNWARCECFFYVYYSGFGTV